MFMLLLTFLLLIKSIQLLLNRKHFSSKKDCFDNNLLLSHNKIKLSTQATLVPIDPGKISEAACRQPTRGRRLNS